jgi:two-component system osmolarity sensor histidine kinase EnvZ
MRDRIERHVEQRTRLLSGVSHDLRTPLTRMKLALAMLDGGAEVAELSRDVREMEHMVDSFLAFARGEAGEAATPVDPGALVRGVAEAAAREGCTVDLSIDLPPDLGTVPMREGAMRRALGNLVSNADAVAATIVLGVRSEGDTLHFTVEDDGPGIPESDVERAMLPFVRLDTARNQNRGSGAGLGLSIVADIAHAHGGTLTLGRSRALGGLRAEIALPR